MNKKLLKRILGVILGCHILPGMCMLSTIGGKMPDPLWVPYFAGWVLNVFGLILYGLVMLIIWCFTDND